MNGLLGAICLWPDTGSCKSCVSNRHCPREIRRITALVRKAICGACQEFNDSGNPCKLRTCPSLRAGMRILKEGR